jgi:hypothetical protein
VAAAGALCAAAVPAKTFLVRFARWGARKYKPAAGEIAPVDFLNFFRLVDLARCLGGYRPIR